jgi:hypothetical protein
MAERTPRTSRKKPVEPDPPRWHIRLGRDAKGKPRPIGYEAGAECRLMDEGRRLTECALVDVGRPFTYHVPSDGQGPAGFVFDGFTGENARPWTAGQVLAAARFGMFGFTLVSGEDRTVRRAGEQACPT